MKDNSACKLKVFDTLQTKLLGSESPAGPNITGTWHDTNDPNNVTRITQHGDRFEFTRTGTLHGILRYESSGSGRMSGETYTSEYHAKYENGDMSTGRCSGTLRREEILTSNCSDTKLREFSGSAFREAAPDSLSNSRLTCKEIQRIATTTCALRPHTVSSSSYSPSILQRHSPHFTQTYCSWGILSVVACPPRRGCPSNPVNRLARRQMSARRSLSRSSPGQDKRPWHR